MTNKILFTIFIFLIIVVIVLIVIGSIFGSKEKANAEVLTDKEAYTPGDSLKVKIENVSEKELCFSTCYPYYIEAKKEGWKSYEYQPCSGENAVDSCVGPGEVKAFELSLPYLKGGLHRLAIPACAGCRGRDIFEDELWLYSNQFEIK